ncbi:hypothetical protein FB451DRAFT_1173378 [Mycena latifolia]|nr:hypothetical protein FB451DRAFT_1173378 [Mycena latifolia]
MREKDARDLGSETIDTNCHSGPLPRQTTAFSQLSCAAASNYLRIIIYIEFIGKISRWWCLQDYIEQYNAHYASDIGIRPSAQVLTEPHGWSHCAEFSFWKEGHKIFRSDNGPVGPSSSMLCHGIPTEFNCWWTALHLNARSTSENYADAIQHSPDVRLSTSGNRFHSTPRCSRESQTGDVQAIIGEEPLGTPSVNVTGLGLYYYH